MPEPIQAAKFAFQCRHCGALEPAEAALGGKEKNKHASKRLHSVAAMIYTDDHQSVWTITITSR